MLTQTSSFTLSNKYQFCLDGTCLPVELSATLLGSNTNDTRNSHQDKESTDLRDLMASPSVALNEAHQRAGISVTEPGRAQDEIPSRLQRHEQQVVAARSSRASGFSRTTTSHPTRASSIYGSRGYTTTTTTTTAAIGLHPTPTTCTTDFPESIHSPRDFSKIQGTSSSRCSGRRNSLRQRGRGGGNSNRILLFVLMVVVTCCLLAPITVQAYTLETSGSVSSSSKSEKLFDPANGVNQINIPQPARPLFSEPENQNSTTRGLEFVTRFFSVFKSTSKPIETTQIPTNVPLDNIPKLTTTTSKATSNYQTETVTSPVSRPDIEEENERPSSEDDDDNAESCQGLSADEPTKGKNLSDAERLVNLQSCLKRKVKQRLLGATRSGMEIYEKLSLSGGCTSSLMNLMANLAEIKSFAFKFIDASAKVPSGVMYGLLSDFGDFDQCLSARSNPQVPLELEAEEGAYSGKYCLMSVKLNYHISLEANQTVPEGIIADGVLWDDLLRNYWTSKSPKGFQVGMCFPSRCTNDDLDQLYRHVAESYHVVGEIISCQDGLDLKRQYEPDLVQQIIISAFYALVIVTTLGTFIHRYYPELASHTCSPVASSVLDVSDSQETTTKNSTCCSDTIALAFKVLICFSIVKNWRTFMRKDHVDRMRIWNNCLFSRTISTSESNKTYKTTVSEGISVSSGTFKTIDPNTVVPLEEPELRPTSCNSKLCQLTVKIQPADYCRVDQEQGLCLSHLSGLRLLVIFWITIGHSFLYPSANNYQHYRSIIRMNITRDSVWFATTNFTLGIDTLLYITGLLFVYKLAQLGPKLYQPTDGRQSVWGLEPNGTGILRLIAKKILRFWPTYVTVIAFAIVVPLFSDGPMWPEMVSKRLGASCRQNWWSNLLFINNFLTESEICLPSSWFVSVLMQLFLIGSLVVILERKYSFSVAAVVICLMLTASCTFSFLYAYSLNLRAPIIRMDETFVLDVDENIWKLYINIFNNLGPFLIGMAGGYLLLNAQARLATSSPSHKSTNTKTKSSSLIYEIMIGLLVAIISVLVLSSVFHKEYSKIGSSIYWSFHRIGWAIVTGYIIHNCATGRWRLLNDLLSLSSLIPFSRLVFIAYLVYPIYIHMHSGLVRDGLHVSIYNMFSIYITRLVITFLTALFIHLLVELPFCSIEEIYLNRLVLKIENETRRKSSSKLNPLLAVAPIVPLHIGDDDEKSRHSSSESP